ncbi:ImmA/IrrE family metallo-endopeptidase [Methylophaga sp.]|uniref:ImmA/IrrE family metallo-endopeptidase n=1 Tax=Methylophaga sp. TaxID=2024840 RepID=UPI003A9374B1
MRIKKLNYSPEWKNLPDVHVGIITTFQKSFPVKVGDIAKALKLTVKQATLPAGISGEIKEVDGQFIIRVNRHDVKYRQRFTVAHEISHFLLHRDKIGDGIIDDVLYRSSLSDALEAQANRLAADIIMPGELIEKELNMLGQIEIEEVEEIAKLAEVSTTALKIKLGLN